jgi:two-component system cell cycle response regulator
MRILIAEDELVQQRLIEKWLEKWGHEVVVANDGTEAWSVLQADNPPMLAILDWMMPGMEGPQICRQLRKCADRPYIYTVLLTAKNEKRDVIAALQAGADDYLAKPFDAQELRARLETGMRILRLQEQLLFASEHDPLTGLLNHGAVVDTLKRELDRAQREAGSIGVILADLDHFKTINDTFGHLEGDSVLRAAARKISSSIRGYDSAGRYGGEEFLIILPGCDLQMAYGRAEQIRLLVSAEFSGKGQHAMPVTVSMGVTADKGQGNVHSVLQAADEALYRAKRNGRNRVESAIAGNLMKENPIETKSAMDPHR